MAKFPQPPGRKGSQRCILNREIQEQFCLPETELITWLSPMADDQYTEYSDQDFINRLDINSQLHERLDAFWPTGGPHWDGLGKSETGKVFLLEAKSHLKEIKSSCKATAETSHNLIVQSLDQTKAYLTNNPESTVDWLSRYYQYTNRLAHLYFLREMNRVHAFLLFVYFENDAEMSGPVSREEWKRELDRQKNELGIAGHRLMPYIAEIFINTNQLLT
jgi:hypothetical protein